MVTLIDHSLSCKDAHVIYFQKILRSLLACAAYICFLLFLWLDRNKLRPYWIPLLFAQRIYDDRWRKRGTRRSTRFRKRHGRFVKQVSSAFFNCERLRMFLEKTFKKENLPQRDGRSDSRSRFLQGCRPKSKLEKKTNVVLDCKIKAERPKQFFKNSLLRSEVLKKNRPTSCMRRCI